MKKLFRGKMMILLIVMVAFGGGGGGAIFVLPKLTHSNPLASVLGSSSNPSPEATPTEPAGHKQGMMYAMADRVVNLGDAGGYRYLKIGLTLEFEMPGGKELKGEAYTKSQTTFAAEIAPIRPVMDDIVTTVLASKTSADLSSVDGKERLRQELKSKFEDVTGEQKLLSVYFTQFIIQ